ncbi:hypothetical protein [Microlunatus sp. Y2014]|uniref:hypothetical protein n=1 Tax=Microlunatus sp. Y2014 TaxID=3418488 RepID=UPI003DA7937B
MVQNLIDQVDFRGILDRVDADLAEAAELLGDPQAPSYLAMKARVDDLVTRSATVRGNLDTVATVAAYEAMMAEVDTLVAAPARLTQVLQLRQEQPGALFGLDTADSMSLVYPKDLTWPGTGTEPVVELARGETEHVQTIVVPYGVALTGVRTSIVGVYGPRGERLPQYLLQASVSPVGSLYTTPSSAYGRPTYTGWTPDPIRDDLTESTSRPGTCSRTW